MGSLLVVMLRRNHPGAAFAAESWGRCGIAEVRQESPGLADFRTSLRAPGGEDGVTIH